jgi:hypothetical protein
VILTDCGYHCLDPLVVLLTDCGYHCLDPLIVILTDCGYLCLDPLVVVLIDCDYHCLDPLVVVLIDCGYHCLDPLVYLLTFQSSDYERTWWRLFHNRLVQFSGLRDTCCSISRTERYLLFNFQDWAIPVVQFPGLSDTCCSISKTERYLLFNFQDWGIPVVQRSGLMDTCCSMLITGDSCRLLYLLFVLYSELAGLSSEKHTRNTSWKKELIGYNFSMSKVAGRPFYVYTNALFLQAIVRVSHAKQALFILREHLVSPPDFSGVHVAPVFRVMFCRWSFVLLSFIFWPLCWLYFYDLRLLITSLVSSNFPCIIHLYLSPIVLFSSLFVLYLPPWLFWIISWLYYYTLLYLHHYYYYFHLLSILSKY